MIELKTKSEIEIMRKAGQLVALTLDMVAERIKDGMTTGELDVLIEDLHLPSIGRKNAAENRQQRGFSTARGAGQEDALPSWYDEINATEYGRAGSAAPIGLVDTLRADRE